MAYISEFRALYHELSEHKTAYQLVTFLEKWSDENVRLIQDLARHRHFDPTFNFDRDELSSWYALSRVNDWLLMSFRRAPGFPTLPEIEYSKFWDALQMTRSYPHDYHPFWCEIVEVEADDNPECAPQITDLLWPALSFGDLLFARAGVRVRSGANFLDAKIAATSTLYNAFRRLNRRTADLSMGWGSNSQWSTDFRRDYVYGEHFLFNVDGALYFNQPRFLQNLNAHSLPQRQFFASQKGGNDDLTDAEREELLIYRSFVKCAKDDSDLWPYDDCFVVKRDIVL